ncbi:hypothetical protein L4C39_03610 [Vibrio clamense]|uniref:hypothetical protein n=1 Tax=Vibrio clamense TaxID=2910254 RepID=UPI003D1C5CBC
MHIRSIIIFLALGFVLTAEASVLANVSKRYGAWITKDDGSNVYYEDLKVGRKPGNRNGYALSEGTQIKIVGKEVKNKKYVRFEPLDNTYIGHVEYSRFDFKLEKDELKKINTPLYISLNDLDLVFSSSSFYTKEMFKELVENKYLSAKSLNSTLEFNKLIIDLRNLKNDFSSGEWSNKKEINKYLDEKLLIVENDKSIAYKRDALIAYEKALLSGKIDKLNRFIQEFNSSSLVETATSKIYELAYQIAIEKSNIDMFEQFIEEYPQAPQISDAKSNIYKLIINSDPEIQLGKLKWFVSEFPSHKNATDAVDDIFNLIKEENNLAAYSWFIDNYGGYKIAKLAVDNLHALAFDIASSYNTIEAYNDFIIAFPIAKQVKEATSIAYELEKDEYVGLLNFLNEEKEARRLLVQSKILEQSATRLDRDGQAGYILVVNRMNDLLKREFNSTDAALRYLESNEFKDFVKRFDSAMSQLESKLSRIADNTSDLSDIMKTQSSMMNNHFEKAAQDREFASKLTADHRFWERHLKNKNL